MSMKQVYRGLGVCAALVSWSAQADVMDEYRDPAFQKGYVVTEYLFDNNPEQKQDSLSVYGEYDAHEYATIYVRLQGARIKNKTVGGMVPDQEKDTDSITAIGTRLRYRFGHGNQHEVGTLLTASGRDYNEVGGVTYRVMPYAYVFSGRTFSARAHIEFDFIDENAWNSSREAWTTVEDREVGLYLRANLTNLVGYVNPSWKPAHWSVSYEDKLASNLDDDHWDISHEHTLSFDHDSGWSVMVAQQKTANESTANVNPFKGATKDGYTMVQVKRQY